MKRLGAVRRITAFLVFITLLVLTVNLQTNAATPNVKLGDDLLLTKYQSWIDGKKLGLVTNQTGVNSKGQSMVQILSQYPQASLKALYTPEYGLDGKKTPGTYVASYTHPELKIPVYSLYGETRMPNEAMLKDIDVLLFDLQDIGARSYTYISTLQYCLVAAEKYHKELIVLDRPNPLGGLIVDGPLLQDGYQSFVGVDNIPMAHGMTVGELAQFFNRKIGANLRVVPMEEYTRTMNYQDTALPWVPSSPDIPHLQAVEGYMATGLGEGTGIYQADSYQWVGGKGINSDQFANQLNQYKLPGVTFLPENRGRDGGVRLRINDPHSFNPAKTGIYVLATAHQLNHFSIPKSTGKGIVMFNKIMGTNLIGQLLEKGYTPQQIESQYAKELEQFKTLRAQFLIYGNVNVQPGGVAKARVTLQGAVNQGKDTFIPINSLLTELGYESHWDQTAKQLVATKPDKRIVVETESNPMLISVNGQYLDTQSAGPRFINDSLCVPASLVPALDHLQATPDIQGAVQWEGDHEVIRFVTPMNEENAVADTVTDVSPKEAPPVVQPPNKNTQPAQPPKPTPAPPTSGTAAVQPKPAVQPLNPNEKVAYLTFDDGPSRVTPEVLDILKQNKIQATFFLVGKNIKGNEALVKRMIADGHAIGGHTYSHDYQKIYHDPKAFLADLDAGLVEIQKVLGTKPTMIRFPGGSNNTVSKKAQDPRFYPKGKWIMTDLVEAVTAKGYQYFDWNVSSGDASGIHYTADEAFNSVKQSSHNKRELVILLHDAVGKQNTAKALPNIIAYLKSQGFTFKTLQPTTQPIMFLKTKSAQTTKQATH
ncbi:exo-beta-N-acetylmuramidase NamZ domain-containing protein [Brevibacillus ginsengisoli]|uniref:exo-beta-N-acetylmuramidase NamZ domain-containing protein n=1 Tax=Brevibacillus ginsengisoli TaxID=363854 RepID=UPI003CE81EE7